MATLEGTVGQSAPTAKRTPRRSRIEPTLLLAFAVLVILVLWVVAPGLFTGHDPIAGVPEDRFLPPSAIHWFGTDYLGRDMYARAVYGAYHTVSGAVIAIAIGLGGGALFGLVAATAGRLADALIMRFVDVLLALPGLLLAMCIVAGLGPGTTTIALGIGIASIAPFARLMRSEVLRVRETEYVEAAAISGSRYWRTLLRHVLPNAAGPVLSLAAVEFGIAILAIAALGYLGYGEPPPTPEWGTMISEGRAYLATSWWLITLPGLVVIAVVLAFNRVSRFLMHRSRL